MQTLPKKAKAKDKKEKVRADEVETIWGKLKAMTSGPRRTKEESIAAADGRVQLSDKEYRFATKVRRDIHRINRAKTIKEVSVYAKAYGVNDTESGSLSQYKKDVREAILIEQSETTFSTVLKDNDAPAPVTELGGKKTKAH